MKLPKPLVVAGLFAALLFNPTAGMAQEAASEDAPPQATWGTQCNSDVRGGTNNCAMEQRIVLRESGQLLVVVTIQIPAEARSPALMIQAPLGIYLPGGITIQIDGGISQRYDVQTCDQNGCYIGSTLSTDLLGAMQLGQTLNIKFQNLTQEEISIPVGLAGFTESYNKIR